jgi:AraC-like DNA-binding protein
VNICLGAPIALAVMPDPARPPGSFMALAAGLQTGPAVIAHDGSAYNVSLQLTPAGARSLLCVPASSLASTVVSLDDLLGPLARELAERLAAAPDWERRFAVLDEVLTRQAREVDVDPVLTHVWRRIIRGGTVRIADLAAETGYRRQHLTKRFRGEFGLTPKQVARVVRFQRSVRLLRELERVRRRQPGGDRDRAGLAEVAARCGFYDQAHLAREWNDLAGCPPSAWLAAEELPFVQAEPAELLAA